MSAFPGVIGPTVAVSEPAWPEPNWAKEGAPNFLFIFLDVLGIEPPTKHTTQDLEMMGHRSTYHDVWRLVCPWPGTSSKESGRGFGAKDLDMEARIQDTVLQKKK